MGWILLGAVVVLGVLTVVAPSAPVVLGLAGVLLFSGLLLTTSFPAGKTYLNSTWGTDDLGEQEEEDYRHKRELD